MRVQTLLPEGNPTECWLVSLLFQSYAEHLSTSKLAQHHVSKIHISRKEWLLLRYGHLWPHLLCMVPSPSPDLNLRIEWLSDEITQRGAGT